MLRNWWKKIGNWWEVEVKEMMSANVSNLFDEFGGEGESPKRKVNLKWFIFPLFSLFFFLCLLFSLFLVQENGVCLKGIEECRS